jgi:hypothetical protein
MSWSDGSWCGRARTGRDGGVADHRGACPTVRRLVRPGVL